MELKYITGSTFFFILYLLQSFYTGIFYPKAIRSPFKGLGRVDCYGGFAVDNHSFSR